MPEDPLETEDTPNGEPKILSFIVRIWKEETGQENPREIWRGHVTPVHTGERHYFTELDQIPALIAAYLNKNQ